MLRLGTPSPSKNRGKIEYAGMVELVDTQDLGSCAARRVGSSPTTRTITLEQDFLGEILALKFFRSKIITLQLL